MQESKVFKVYLGYRKNTNSRFSNSMNFIQSDSAEAANKLAKKLTIAMNPGIKEIHVNNCFEVTGEEIKKVPANRLLTKENFSQWLKITSEPAKGILKLLTIPAWLKKKSVTNVPSKPVEKTETEWEKINGLSHNRDFDNNIE